MIIIEQLEDCLSHIFSKYCTPSPTVPENAYALLKPPPGACLTTEGLDKWATDTNGAPFSAETKEELIEMLDVGDDGRLTWVLPSSCTFTALICDDKASMVSCKYINCRHQTTKKKRGEIWFVEYLQIIIPLSLMMGVSQATGLIGR